jgi:hypothetical protein
MDQCRSFGSSADSLHGSRGKRPLAVEAGVALGGNAINFLGNSRFKSSVAFMTMATSVEMVGREDLLTRDALVVSEEGPMGLRSAKELKGIIFHHFLFCKHELYVYRSHPAPFIIIFCKKHPRDVVFAAGRIIEGSVELRFKAWEVDEFGNRLIIPNHVKLSIEGIPHHAWFKEVANKVVGQEACIHYVEECTRKRLLLELSSAEHSVKILLGSPRQCYWPSFSLKLTTATAILPIS